MTTAELLDISRDLCNRRQAHVWITVVAVRKPSSTYVGAQAIIEADGGMHGWIGGGCVRGAAQSAALLALTSATPQRLRLSNTEETSDDAIDVRPMNCASDGEVELFIQPVEVAPRLRIYGRTPVAEAAAWFARQSDLDPLTDAEAADVQSVASLDSAREPVSTPQDIHPETYALIATQGEGDEAALEQALRSSACAILLIASRRKTERLRAAMTMRGISAERLDVIYAPAGPDIGAVTPKEIALSAIAGVVALRRRHDSSAGRAQKNASVDKPSQHSGPQRTPQATGYVNPVCGVVVDPARALSKVTLEGQTHYFCCGGCRAEFDKNPQKYLAIGAHMRAPTHSDQP